MFIKEISLTNFRNLENQKIELNPLLNIFQGKNAQGKTNLLESIFFCAIGKSSKSNKSQEAIKWNEHFARITIKAKKQERELEIDFRILENGKKIILINQYPIKNLGELLGELNIISFFPDDLKLIKDGPSERRKFLDIVISQLSKMYFNNLVKYNSILAQRNKLLKLSKTLNEVKQTIDIWNEQLSTAGAYLIHSRINFLNKIKPLVSSNHQELSNNSEKLDISYLGLYGNSLKETKEKLLKLYLDNLEKDFTLKHTTIGPHKDDFKITINETDLKTYGSQGQQRTASLALKFAQIELFKNEFQDSPILLLDDVLSEIDSERQQILLSKSNKLQTLLTTTDNHFNIQNCTQFQVYNGKINKSN